MTRIIIGADICPTESNYELFRYGDREALIGNELCDIFDKADYLIFNLETPLYDSLSPIHKCGPCLATPTYCMKGLKSINPYFFTLANNHIFDQGTQGLLNTENCLNEYGISFAGIGENIDEACKPAIVEINGIKLGIYCCTEHEFSIATDASAGANPYEPLYSFDHVSALKKKTDYVIVLFHGGKEYYRYPSPNLQRTFRKFSEVSADLVIAQHTHCIGCKEEYRGATLVYGQGNFLFDHLHNEYWDSGLLIELRIEEDATVDFIPIVRDGNHVRKADAKEADVIIRAFESRNAEVVDPVVVQQKYKDGVLQFENEYYARISGFFGHLLPIRALNFISGGNFVKLAYRKKFLYAIENTIACEAHREAFLESLKRRM